jgi:hypothetical protein
MVPVSRGTRRIPSTDPGRNTDAVMTELELELAALRERRQSSGIVPWLRGLRLFDRRAIKEPDVRDAYWVNLQRRLAESDAAFLTRYEPYG